MKVYTDNIHIDFEHKYSHESVGKVESVTSILNNYKTVPETSSVYSGNQIHSALESFFKKEEGSFKKLASEMNAKDFNKTKQIAELIAKLNIKSIYSELSFIAKDGELQFGGTADLVSEDTVIDFKTGAWNAKYKTQVSVYAKALDKKRAIIIYFKDEKSTHRELNAEEIDKAV